MTDGGSDRLPRRTNALALAAIVGLAAALVASTWSTYAATFDEGQHIAAGLDWLGGSYTLWRDQHVPHVIVSPPLARAAVAAGPWLAGLRLGPLRGLFASGPAHALALARAGVLPFFALAIVLTWVLARRALADDRLALVAAALFALCPVALAHAGLATTDMPFTAMALLALVALAAWLDAPSRGRAAALGAAFGLAFATKLSAPLLALLAAVAALVRRRVAGPAPPRTGRSRLADLAIAAGVAALVVFAAYRFDVGQPRARADSAVLDDVIDGCFSSSTGRRAARALADTTLPAPALYDGLVSLCAQNARGRSTSYLLGRISQDGFPLFFPVAIGVKTPLPLLALAGLGVALLLRRAREARGGAAPGVRWTLFAAPWVAAAFIAAAIPSRINIGVRHVLPIYPLFAVLAAYALGALWRADQRARLARGAAALLGAWSLVIPLVAAPDFLPWFNALAGRHPQAVLLDSDLDWGQDLLRLERELAARKIEHPLIAYWGAADLCREVPGGRWLPPRTPATGWIAISETYRKGVAGFYYRDGDYCDPAKLVTSAPPDPHAYAWLDAYQPVARIGASILLYDVPEGR